MPKFLIEAPHEAETVACARVIQAFLRTGSHFLTRADWGCKDGIHKAWITVDVDTKEEARNILPAHYRSNATITQLNYFTLEEIDELLEYHKG